MAKKEKLKAPDDQSIGLGMQQSAVKLGLRLNDALMSEIDALNKAKQDWEGGAFTVMAKLTSVMTDEELDALPDPKAKTGQNPAYYLRPVTKISAKGKASEEWKEHYYYRDMTLNMPGITGKLQLKDQIERSMGDDEKVNKSGIPDFVMNWSLDYRKAQADKLQGEVNAAIKAVSNAFELYHQLKIFNEELGDSVSALPVFAIGQDGKPMNGAGGRPMKVEATKTPIIVRTTVPERALVDVKMVSIGTFLKYDVLKAADNGGTYEAVMNTIQREQGSEQSGHQSGTGNAQDASRPQAVNTADTAIARIVDVAEYTTRAMEARDKAQWEQLKKELTGAGSDEAFLSARDLLQALTVLVGSPADAARDAKVRGEQEAA